MAASLMRRREPGMVLDFSREEDDEPELKRIANGPEIVVSGPPVAFAHSAPADHLPHIQIGKQRARASPFHCAITSRAQVFVPSPHIALALLALALPTFQLLAKMSAPIDLTRQPSMADFPKHAIDVAVSDLEFCTGPQATAVQMKEWMYSVVDSLVSGPLIAPGGVN